MTHSSSMILLLSYESYCWEITAAGLLRHVSGISGTIVLVCDGEKYWPACQGKYSPSYYLTANWSCLWSSLSLRVETWMQTHGCPWKPAALSRQTHKHVLPRHISQTQSHGQKGVFAPVSLDRLILVNLTRRRHKYQKPNILTHCHKMFHDVNFVSVFSNASS